ncbi:MAG: hypothetical protein IKU19_01625, partial [Clostridia bacterium]|nr:hypothetical protein [Clostridia bacterium]
GVYTCTEYYSKEKGYEKDFPEAALAARDSVDMDEMWAELENKATQQLTSVIYYYSDGASALKSASLVLWGKENFQFSYSYLSSNLCMGKYTREGNKLILSEDDSDKVYTFIIDDRDLGKIVFDAENSSELPKYKYVTNAQPEVCLPDGAVFKTAVDITAGYDAILDVEVVDGVLYTLQVNSKLVTENKVNTCGSVILISLIETLSDDVVNKRTDGAFLSTPINKAILDIDYPYTETGRDGTTVTAYEYHLKDIPVGQTISVTITKELKERLGLESDVIEITTVENQVNTESDIYTEDEILSAVAVIEKDFETGWQGCVLNEIYYAGDEKSKEYQDWADRNDADEALVLLSSFYVDESCPIGSLNKGNIYSNWMWILVRTDGGEWVHVDHGY